MTFDPRILPETFVNVYEALYCKALDDGMGGSRAAETAFLGKADGKPVGQWRVSTGEMTSMDKIGGPGTKQVGKTARTMRDERAFRLKVKIDKRLRAMAREINAFLDGVDKRLATQRVCAGRCKHFGDAEWNYCPSCGGPMRELEKSDV